MTSPESPSFELHTSNRLDVLVGALIERLASTPLPPLVPEVVIVQSFGMERWLRLEIARRVGIAGHLDFKFPATFLAGLAERLLDRAAAPGSDDASPSGNDRDLLTWRLFGLLGELMDNARSQSPRESSVRESSVRESTPELYLADDPDQRKRYQLASRLAGLFLDYPMFRPELVADWEQGATPTQGPGAWQAPLWRRLREPLTTTEGAEERFPSQRFSELLEWLETTRPDRDTLLAQGLPRRLSLFGIGTLPPLVLRLLRSLARTIPVRLYFVSPTYHYWGDLRSERELVRLERRLRSDGRRLDEAHFAAGHRLLTALGRQGRDFFNLLQEVDSEGDAWHELAFEESVGDSVLAQLQRDVLHLVEPGSEGIERRVLDPMDRSLTLHVCHSPMREMEVLRNELLALFANDPDLRPHDVLVLLSDVERYSPYIEAVFGTPRGLPRRGEGFGEIHLPYSIADRRAGASRPAAETALRILELVSARRTLGEVFDLLDTPAVRRRFELDAAEVADLRRRLDRARVRWGAEGVQRERDFGLPADDANTWRQGLDRLLVGATTGPVDALVSGLSPLAGDLVGDLDALGRLVVFVETLFRTLDRLRRRRPPKAWALAIGRLLDDLFEADDEDEEEALQLVRKAARTLHDAEARAGVDSLDLEVVRRHLGDRLADDGGPGPFLTGRITFCALKPMRTIPFSVVCIAGLDDGVFPRRDPPQGFDLIRHRPRLGDRSLRDDDRYLFLETLLAARRRLILSTVGRSQQDGGERAPSVVVSELFDHLDRGFETVDGCPASTQLVIEHRLQAFHPAYFEKGDGNGEGDLFSYSPRDLASARALVAPRQAERPFFVEEGLLSGVLDSDPARLEEGGKAVDGSVGEIPPSPPLSKGGTGGRELDTEIDRKTEMARAEVDLDTEMMLVEIDLDELTRFWIDPCRHYVRRVLGIEPEDPHRDLEADAEPFATDGLAGYQAREWLLERRLRGLTAGDDELERLRALGDLPLAGLGAAEYQSLNQRVEVLAAVLPRPERLPPRAVEITGPSWRLVGTLDDLTTEGALRFRPAGVRGKDRLRAWIRHLVWNLDPGELSAPRKTHLLGENPDSRRREQPWSLQYRPVAKPHHWLEHLVEGYLRGLEKPLPVFPEASLALVEQQRKVRTATGRVRTHPLDAARKAFFGNRLPGQTFSAADQLNPAIALCFRGREPLEDPDFPRWSERLWGPLLDHEEHTP